LRRADRDAAAGAVEEIARIVAHPRAFGRGATVYDPWHYVPVLARKPGALRNGAPFKAWVLPAAMERVRRNWPGPTTAIGRWSNILVAVLADGCRRSRRPAPKRSPTASTPPTSSARAG
jgi:hypothetical protein